MMKWQDYLPRGEYSYNERARIKVEEFYNRIYLMPGLNGEILKTKIVCFGPVVDDEDPTFE